MILLKNFEKKAWSRKCTTLPTLKNRTSCPTLWRPLDDQGCRIVIRDPINSELKKASRTSFINFYQCWMKLRMILEWHASGHYPRICRQRRCIQYRRFCRIPVRSNGCRSQSRKQPAPGLCLPRNCRTATCRNLPHFGQQRLFFFSIGSRGKAPPATSSSSTSSRLYFWFSIRSIFFMCCSFLISIKQMNSIGHPAWKIICFPFLYRHTWNIFH